MNFKSKEEKIKTYESIYSVYADTVYKVCLWLAKEKEPAVQLTKQTFLDTYDCLELLNEQEILPYLICHAKELASQDKSE